MANENIISKSSADYSVAVNTIKDAILRSQYRAAKMVNREMLSPYYGIGRYISANSRDGFWGTGTIKTISECLRKEMPGLKGFSETNLKNLRLFFEEWVQLFEPNVIEINTDILVPIKSPAAADDLENFL